MYRVAIYQDRGRFECRSAYDDYYQARTLFKCVCKTYKELPLSTICSLECGADKLEAYQFTTSFDTLPVNTLSSSLGDLVARRQSFTSPNQRRPSMEMLQSAAEPQFSGRVEGQADQSQLQAPPATFDQSAAGENQGHSLKERIRRLICFGR